jgi:hypothetical protein
MCVTLSIEKRGRFMADFPALQEIFHLKISYPRINLPAINLWIFD